MRYLVMGQAVLLSAALLATTAQAESVFVDGREVPRWNDSSIVLPGLAFDGQYYDVELRLAAAGANPVLQVSDVAMVEPQEQAILPQDSAARYENGLLQIPVFESGGRLYAAELEPLVLLEGSAQSFRVARIWHVTNGRLSVPIGGLAYTSGSRSAETDSQGRYYPVSGQPATFALGGRSFGGEVSRPLSGVVEYSSLFAQGEDDPAYKRSLRVLGLLDADANSVNGIQIAAAGNASVASALAAVDLSGSGFESQYTALVNAVKAIAPAAVAYNEAAAEINFQKLEIQTYMIARLQEKSIPGVALSIELPNGEMWHTAAGVANTQTGEVMTPEHQFRIGSATKSFTGMLIMQLVDEGKLELDQKLNEFFPGEFPDGDVITIKMLLNHTAGIFSFTNEFPGFQQAYGVTMDSPPHITDLWFVRYIGMPGYVYRPGDLVSIGASVNSSYAKNDATLERPYLVNEPGKAWNYSNTHYVLLQEIAEMITGNSWEDEIRSRFVEPLGLDRTIVPSAGDLLLQGTYARGYINWADNQGPEVADLFGFPHTDIERSNTDPSYTMGSGAIISTTTDLVKWADAVMEGQLLSPETQALMREPFEVASAFGESINMLQGVVQDLNLQVFGHRGQIAGYDASWQYHYRDPNDVIGTGTAMAVLLNRTLLTEFNPDGTPNISNVNAVMLEGILDILYGDE